MKHKSKIDTTLANLTILKALKKMFIFDIAILPLEIYPQGIFTTMHKNLANRFSELFLIILIIIKKHSKYVIIGIG